uniref:Zinc finger protein 469 n=1 Tax=Suricata suricatta TaxID=37032 RepID=A0A673UWH6_SURSU
MPGEQPRRAPPAPMTRDLQPCPGAGGTGGPSHPPSEDGIPASRTSKATGSGAPAGGPPETQQWQAGGTGEPKAPPPRTPSRSSVPGEGGGPRAPPGRSRTQASSTDGSPQQLCTGTLSGSPATPALDETPEGPPCKDPEAPEAEAPEELSFQRCFQEAPSSFTSTNYTSPNAASGPPPLRAPPSSGANPGLPAPYSEPPGGGANAWPPAVNNSFPGARFGVPPAKPEPFPKGDGPGVAPFQLPFLALRGSGPKAFLEGTAQPEFSERALVFAFHQPQGAWPEEAGTAFPLPSLPAPQPPPCYPGQPGFEPPGDLGCAAPQPGAAHLAPSPFLETTAPFPDSLHKSLTKALPERPTSAHEGLGSPRGPPNSLPQRHFPGQAYGSPGASGVSSSPRSLDTELAAPGPLPTRLPPLWDRAAAPYPTPPLGPPATARNAFFEGQPGLGQSLGLPQSPPLTWPQVLPTAGPSPHPVEVLSRLPFPPGGPEWQGGSQGALGAAAGKTAGQGEKLALLRSSPGQQGVGSPGLFAHNGLKDPAARPLFFTVAQPQVSPRGAPGLPPPRVVAASPCQSPLPSPAANTASSSSCSSLSPLPSSPANPSSEEGQLPGPLGPSSFFHRPPPAQETRSPYPSPEPSHTIPIHYQPEPLRAFPSPTDGLGAEGTFKCLEEAPFPGTGPEGGSAGLEGFPREPPPYPAHHFPLSSASLDQLDVLLTCRQCDQNYGSLAAFLGHRQFCSALRARAKDVPQQPPGPPAVPRAPGSGSPGLLGHTKAAPFLPTGDVRADGKDDPLRTSFLPGLAAAPFPLPAAGLDLEDDAKLDSLITEALNGLGYQSDNPEIDSSFIDVFADEEPSGPRGPGAGQPSRTRVGTAPESKAQAALPAGATPPEPPGARPGRGSPPARSRPQTRSLGPAPVDADGAGPAGQHRRGKRFKLFQKELGTPSTTKSRKGPRATRPRQRRKGHRAEPSLPCLRDLRTQAPKSQGALARQALPVETRSSQRLRHSPGKASGRRQLQGGTWSKELIHKIVLQKNKQPGGQGQGGLCPPGSPGPAPGSADVGPQELTCASESEEEEVSRPRGSRLRGRPRHGCRRWRRGARQKEGDVAPGPKEDPGRQKPRKVVRPEAAKDRGSPSPGPQEGGPKHLVQAPEENHPAPDCPQDSKSSEPAEKLPPDALNVPAPAPGRGNAQVCHGSPPAAGAGSLPGAARCAEPPVSRDGEGPPAYPPGELLVPVADTADLESGVLFLKTPHLGCDSALFNGDSVGVPFAKKRSQPFSGTPSKLFLGPKDLPGYFQDLYSKPLASDAPPTSGVPLPQEAMGPGSLEPKPPRDPSYAIRVGPGGAKSPPLTLEPTPLFPGLPVDRLEPPIYSSLSGSGLPPLPRRPQLEPPYSPFLPDKGWTLLEEPPVLASHLPDLLGEKAFRGKGPAEGTEAAGPPPLPSKVSECGGAFMGNLSEDELEIKRLVAELESQLQSKGAPEAPELPCVAGHTGTGAPLPSPQAVLPPGDTFPKSEADLTSLGELSLRPEGAGAAVAATEGTLRSTRGEGPSSHPGEAAPFPRAPADALSGAPRSFRAGQSPSVSEPGPPTAEGDGGVHPEASLSGSREPFKPPSDVRSLAEGSPHREPLLSKNSRATGAHQSDTQLFLPCTQAPGPHLEPPRLEASRGATAARGDSHSDAPKGSSGSRAGLPHPGAGSPGLQANEELVPAEALPGPACVPDTSPGRRPQVPATSPLHQLQLLVARAAGKDALGSQGPPSADARSPQRTEPSDLEGDSVQGGDTACSPTQDVPGGVRMTAVPAVAGCQLGPEADGHLGSCSRAEKPQGQGRASGPQPEKPGSLGGADSLLPVHADPAAAPAVPAGGADHPGAQLQGNGGVLGLQKETRATPGPTFCDAEPLVAAHAHNGPGTPTSEEAASLAPLVRGRASGAPLSPPAATTMPPGPGQLPQEDPSSGERTGLLPARPCRKDPPSPRLPPAHSPAGAPPHKAACTPATTDAPAAPPSLRTSPCGFKESLAPQSLPGDQSPPEDPPLGQPSFIGVFTPAQGEDHPEGSTSGPLEDSRKEKPRRSPASATPPPPVRATSPPGIPAPDSMGPAGRLDQPCRRAAPHTSRSGMPTGSPSSDPPGQGVPALPADPSTWGTPEPDSYGCQEGQGGASPSAGTKASQEGSGIPPAPCPPTELRQGRVPSPSRTASDPRPGSPQSLGNVHHTPRRDPLHSQGTRQEPRGFKKKPVSTENGHWKDRAPGRRPVTCEVCAASFRSGPGLSRHRARKHGPHRGAASPPSPPAPPAPQNPASQPPGKKSRRAPGKERMRQALSGPSHILRPPPDPGAEAPPHPPGLAEPGADGRPAVPRRQDRLVKEEPCPKQTERGGGQRRGRALTDVPSRPAEKSQEKARKPRARRSREGSGPPISPGVITDRFRWDPSTVTSSSLRPPGSQAPDTDASWPPVVEGVEGTDPEETPARKSPRDRMAPPGGLEAGPPGNRPGGRKEVLARGCWGPKETRPSGIYKEPSGAARSEPAGNSRAAKGGSRPGSREVREPPSCPPAPPETCTPVDGSSSSWPQGPLLHQKAQARLREEEGAAPEAPSPGLGDPPSVFDDEASFSELFPSGGRLTRKKNPRVYGKRCKQPPAPPTLEPQGEAGGVSLLASAHLPTDLSDSGSLCLSHEHPWGDEATGLPDSFLLEGLLSKVPGIDPWALSPSLWAPEPVPEVACSEDGPHGCSEDHPSENIPELHMVPAAWRDLELQTASEEMAPSLGDVSPEPPDLEREHYDSGLAGNAVDLEMLSAKLEVQDLCFLGPCEDPVGIPSPSFLGFGATVSSQEPQNQRAQDAAGAGGAAGRERHPKARRAAFKCKVCFQRFRGLGELDLHKLAHSPSPPPTCYMCVERRFRSRDLLRQHLQEKHAQSKAGRWACGMCLREVADVWMYNEHLREHALRFARKGQARRTLGDWEGDGTGTHFLGSVVGQASRPSGGKRSIGKANGGPAEASGQQTEAGKESGRERVKPKAPANLPNQDGAAAPAGTLADRSPLSGSAKTSPSLSAAPCPHGEPLLRAVSAHVHEGCKDPSRDCHHCGKRFPKPFKLQRHLAVHSPQRVYLCPQCPRVYAEPQELRAHLAGEHGAREERELQHTPLYACELCANVTHISKRSFVCSSCNYTFAKKEQFDRHMDKHLRKGQQPFTFRGVRRPGAPTQRAPAREGTLPSKRRKVAPPSSPPGPGADRPLSCPVPSEGSLPALLQPCPEAAPGTTKGQPRTPERPVDLVGHPVTGGDLPSDLQELLPPALSPFPAASADGKDGHKPDGALESSEDEASPGGPGPLLPQALPLGGSLPRPGARGPDGEVKRAAGPFSGRGRTSSASGKCAPEHGLEAPSLSPKKKVSPCPMLPDASTGDPSHKGSATKALGCQSLSKDRSVLSTAGKAPKVPMQPKEPGARPTAREPAQSTEDRPKPTIPKAKPSPSSQGRGGPRHSTKTAGGSQPQPASGQLQSETATTPAKPSCPGQGPAPDKHPPRAPAKGSPKGPKEAADQGPQGSLGPREDGEISEKKRKGRAPGPAKSESVRSLGRAHLVPDKPARAPRKQATPSRVLPAKARPSSRKGTMPPQLYEQQRQVGPGHTFGDCRRPREGQGKACPQGRPLHRTPKRDRAVHGAESAKPRTCRTAESQNDLLSQLFGQRLTSFKIPLKKDPSE